MSFDKLLERADGFLRQPERKPSSPSDLVASFREILGIPLSMARAINTAPLQSNGHTFLQAYRTKRSKRVDQKS